MRSCPKNKRRPLHGEKFGRLTVLHECEAPEHLKERRLTFCVARCECGSEKIFKYQKLTSGWTKSCGCVQKEAASKTSKSMSTHNESNTRIYSIWTAMTHRCKNPKSRSYNNYGARGITVCKEWEDFNVFKLDMGEPPAGYEIDRIDNMLGYFKENCRWVSKTDNARNRRTNRFIDYNGRRLTITQWSQETGLSRSTIIYRLENLNWTVEQSLTAPADPYKNRKRGNPAPSPSLMPSEEPAS